MSAVTRHFSIYHSSRPFASLSNNLQSTHYGLSHTLQISSFTLFYCSDHTARIKGSRTNGYRCPVLRERCAGCTLSPPRRDSPRHHRSTRYGVAHRESIFRYGNWQDRSIQLTAEETVRPPLPFVAAPD